jgi:hypothetical protein
MMVISAHTVNPVSRMKTSLIARQWWIVGQKWPSERLQTTVYGRATPRNVNLKKETIEESAPQLSPSCPRLSNGATVTAGQLRI